MATRLTNLHKETEMPVIDFQAALKRRTDDVAEADGVAERMNRIGMMIGHLASAIAQMREHGADTPAIVRVLRHAIEEHG
jgi:hypothetical protein